VCKTNTLACELPRELHKGSGDIRGMNEGEERVLAWMALLARPRSGPVAVRREVERAGDVLAAWGRFAREHPDASRASFDLASERLDRTRTLGGDVLTFGDPRYPALLSEIADPPPVLFFQGTWPDPAPWGRALAVVGTRSCTPQGAGWARQLGKEWTEAGGTLVSGLARGVDGRAHRGVLDGPKGGAQVAVLPCSLEAIHPRMHEPLAREILDRGGLLLTEQPPGVQVERWMFASRNRILTGLAPRTVVVQSPARGGSLISARCALDQNRDVFALWRSGMGPAWAGNRALVADAEAFPVQDIDALWRALEKEVMRRPGARFGAFPSANPAGIPEGCANVWRALSSGRATSWVELKKKLGGPEQELERQLFTLEVLGWIRRVPGRAYLRA
jgi:DNA processing protein